MPTAPARVTRAAPKLVAVDRDVGGGEAAGAPSGEPTRDLLARFLVRSRAGDAGAMAEALLDRFGDLNGVCTAAVRPGSNCALLARVREDLVLLQALAERMTRPVALGRTPIGSSSQLQDYVRVAMAGRVREQFRVLFLDSRNRLLRDDFLAEGTVNHAPVYPREVVGRALELGALSMILVHNHPAGDPTPSRADIEMTRQLVDAAKPLGIQIHDHLVVGREGIASFKALGLM